MDAATEDELRMLRRRAYGPDADIQTDPAAMDRLRRLEAAAARVSPSAIAPSAADPAEEDEPTTDATPVPVDPGVPAPPDAPQAPTGMPSDEGDAADTPERSRLSRRTIWLWAASIVVALVVGAGITTLMPATGAGRVATIAEADLSEWPADVFGDPQEGARIFEAYEGLRVLVIPNAWGSSAAALSCVFVVRSDREGGTGAVNEIVTTGCGAGDFPPTAAFPVNEESPEALRDRFADGTDLRIVLAEDEVHVFAKEP